MGNGRVAIDFRSIRGFGARVRFDLTPDLSYALIRRRGAEKRGPRNQWMKK